MFNFPGIAEQFIINLEENVLFSIWVSTMLGATMASFAGVVVDRLPHQMGWIDNPKDQYTISHPGSQCNKCNRSLTMVELIPVIGWILSRGKCKTCGVTVPVIYPLSEALMASVFTLCSLYFKEFNLILIMWILVWCSYVIAMLDLRHHWIPGVISMPLMWAGLMISPFEPDVYQRIYAAVGGSALMIGTFFYVGRRLNMDVYSGGDVALAMVGGAWLGVNYLPYFLILGAIIFIPHCAWEKKKGLIWVPFGPSLLISLLTICIYSSHFIQ